MANLIISGKWGNVDGVENVRNWSLTKTSAPKSYNHSGLNKGTGRKPGTKDWSGSYATYSNIGFHLARVGTLVSFLGYTGPTNGVSGAGKKYGGNILLNTCAVNWNWESNDLVQSTQNFGGNGALTETSATTTELNAESFAASQTPGFFMGDGDATDAICGIKNATFNLLVPEKTFVNSCTEGWTGRRAGAGLDCNLSITMDGTGVQEDFGLEVGEETKMSLYISDTDYIYVNAMHLREISGITIDRETGNIIGYTANFDLNIDLNDYGTGDEPALEIRQNGSGSPLYTLWEPL